MNENSNGSVTPQMNEHTAAEIIRDATAFFWEGFALR